MSIIKANNLTKTYGSEGSIVTAVNGISFTIEEGEFVCIVGRSGSGKSTLLNLLAALDKPTSGELYFKDLDMMNMSEKQLNRFRRENMSVIFQFHHLLPYFTALENVLLPYMSGIAPINAEHRRAAENALDRVGLQDKKDRLPGQLSGGEQQRVAIARSLCASPDILFADEPTGSLDRETGDSVMSLLSELNKQGLAIVMVTHQEDYTKLASKILRMQDGNII
ncbi:MAG: ABC transporter ATP-binding protein [Deferribacteraceae bacterium]|jgi:putative ABC transport system ATP-binding protein|nr:ABC transporter ATP-binding protein [Deferribacteraceae bacterium]